MGSYIIEYFRAGSGRVPAKEFIDSLDPRTQAKFFAVKELLESFGHKLPQPHAKYIGDKIFELRFHGVEGGIRVLYFFIHLNRVIFTNGFIKKTNKTPKNEKAFSIKIRKQFEEAARNAN